MFFGWGGCVMVGQTTGHLTEGAEPKTAESGKPQRRAAADKIRKMIRKCKADTKAIRQLDDEQTEYLERLRKHP
jgi:acyl-CoA reductase-like NAD-dependent aldehyde dehydrogenase